MGDSEESKGLPICVILNPKKGAMWFDELSGLCLSQWPGIDNSGKEIKNWGRVPTDRDCTRIEIALRNDTLFPCNPKGECIHISNSTEEAKTWIGRVMKYKSREILALIDQIIDANVLSSMKSWELDRSKKDVRTIVLTAINERLRSPYVAGVTNIASTPAMILDKDTGKMVEDRVTVG